MRRKVVTGIFVAIVCISALAACGKETTVQDNTSETAAGSTESTETVSESTEEAGTTEVTEDTTEAADAATDDSEKTVADKLCDIFTLESGSEDANVEGIAGALAEADCFEEVSIATVEVTEGYLNGFNEEIYGFTSGQMVAPMIGTIPFVSYVFETDDPDGLAETLKSNAALDWNICTEADEMKVEINGNYVFFVMSPYSFED